MPIEGELIPWNKPSIHLLAEPKGAVYALVDKKRECIYIGETSDLKDRFINKYWNNNFADDSCKRDTAFFKFEYRKDHKERELFLLTVYVTKHGKLPRCNEKMP